MTPNGVATLFSRLDWLWPEQAVAAEKGVLETWIGALRGVNDDEVFEAVPLMATTHPRRPVVADIVAAARAVRASHPVPALPPYTPQTKRYGEAWYAVGTAVREGRLPRAELDQLAEKHVRWFAANGQDSIATGEMLAEVETLAKKTGAGSQIANATTAKFKSRYSDEHKARYMANVAAKEATISEAVERA